MNVSMGLTGVSQAEKGSYVQQDLQGFGISQIFRFRLLLGGNQPDGGICRPILACTQADAPRDLPIPIFSCRLPSSPFSNLVLARSASVVHRR